MKAKVYCFGHGWAFEYPSGQARYVGRWEEIWPIVDEWMRRVEINACLDDYRARMGTEAQTKGMA